MPHVKGPEDGLDLVSLMRGGGNEDADALSKEWAALDVRWLGNSRHGLDPTRATRPAPRCGSRSRARWATTPSTTSRRSPTPATSRCWAPRSRPTTTNPSHVQMASLDHTIWFHRPFRVDDWWLYDQQSPSASGARGFAFGRVFTRTAPWWPRSPRRA